MINVELLLKIKAKILANPESFYMGSWIIEGPEGIEALAEQWGGWETPPCGTVACIAGWAQLLGAPERKFESSVIVACDVLRVPTGEYGKLFYEEEWPPEFCDRYQAAESLIPPDHQEMAKAAADRIDHFIATDGAE